jgi:hypothetical protein
MSSANELARTMTLTGILVAAVYGATRVVLRGRRAWRNVKIIKSVDTGSVWTTE